MTADADGHRREIRYEAILQVTPDRAFAFVSDPRNWPTFFDPVRSAEALTGWGRPGGRGRLVTSFLGRAVTSDLEVTEWDPPWVFRYTARQRGRPDLDRQPPRLHGVPTGNPADRNHQHHNPAWTARAHRPHVVARPTPGVQQSHGTVAERSRGTVTSDSDTTPRSRGCLTRAPVYSRGCTLPVGPARACRVCPPKQRRVRQTVGDMKGRADVRSGSRKPSHRRRRGL